MLLHLLAHSVKHQNATVRGRRLKAIVCEKCETEYWYFLSRVGAGQGTYFALSSGEGAKARAQQAAQANLAVRLSRESELVPCPNCHWINSDLVRLARRRIFRRMPLYAFLLLLVGGLAFPLVLLAVQDNYPANSPRPTILAEEVSGCFAGMAVALFFLRSFLRTRLNPNRNFPQPPVVRPGTPPSIIVVDDTREERGRLGLADVHYALPAKFARWVVLRSGQLSFPQVCCLCLNPTPLIYKPRVKSGGEVEVSVPYCADCRRVFRWAWWLSALVCVFVAALIGIVAAWGIAFPDQTARVAFGSIIAIFIAAIAIVIFPERICRPYRLSYIDRDRGVMKFASKNEDYNQKMIDQVQQTDAAQAAEAVFVNW